MGRPKLKNSSRVVTAIAAGCLWTFLTTAVLDDLLCCIGDRIQAFLHDYAENPFWSVPPRFMVIRMRLK